MHLSSLPPSSTISSNPSATSHPVQETPLWQILAIRTRLPARNIDPLPSPIGTTPITTINKDIRACTLHRPSDAIEDNITHGDPISRHSLIIVVLTNDDPVLGNLGERDVFVGYRGDGTGVARDGLDATPVLGGFHFGRGECYPADGVVCAPAYAADAEAVTSAADAGGE